MDIRANLIAQANADNAAFPQYKGYFDSYILVKIKKVQRTKLGIAFDAGEVAIAKPNLNDRGNFTVYSIKNKINTSVKYSDVQYIDKR